MIKNSKVLDKFEKDEIRNNKTIYVRSMQIFEALWSEAMNLGVLPLKDPLEGVETSVRIARILNSRNV